ncbi:MAG: hypothetical protein M0R80_17480 [Proteobacteria bacterium]|jgi:hypothetical protein|nr:hypothetical protein [Pseudomonadota bacterium]
MAFIPKDEIKSIYDESKLEQTIWQEDYPTYERLANNDLIDGLDENLPEVNDGSLAAALFKLPKRIVSSKLSGKVKPIDRDEAWIAELANLQWNNEIIPNANSQAPFTRKWKDSVRKSAIYGSVPIINLFVNKGDYTGSDFIIAQPQDVSLEPGKVSDTDSDVIFWEVYYTKLQLKNIIEQAKKDKKQAKADGVEEGEYNKWDIAMLEEIIKLNAEEKRKGTNGPKTEDDKGIGVKGIKFVVAFQRGIKAPFYMFYSAKNNKCVREWTNPDPTGDIPIHYLYCYQDFINPYGIGIVKLAGGTQNVLDYMRQADVLATQVGIRPPIAIEGNEADVDIDSIVYSQDAIWFTGGAKVVRQELANGIYAQLPGRVSMYKTSLNQLIPLGDTSATAAESGDPTQSKTPAGVKMQAALLSVDDQDFKDNLYATYEAVARSMINTHFANMQGSDLMKLSDDEREILKKAGLPFPENENGEMSNELDVVWDKVRATFEFEIDPDVDKTKDDADKLEGLMKVAELKAANPELDQELAMSQKKLNMGELMSEIIKLTSDNKKIITDISPEDEAAQQMGQPQIDPQTGQPITNQPDPLMEADLAMKQQKMQQSDDMHQAKMAKMTAPDILQEQDMSQGQDITPEMQANIDALMKEFGVDENIALAALSAEAQGEDPATIIEVLKRIGGGANV